MLLFYPILLVFIFSGLLYYYCASKKKYWKSRNIPGPSPLLFFGNFKDYILRKSIAPEIFKNIYDQYEDAKVIGVFRINSPTLIIKDLEVVKCVLIQDFEYFTDRGLDFGGKGLGANLFNADLETWRPLRKLFSPLFTTAKLKNMVPLVVERSNLALNYFQNIIATSKDQDVYLFVQRFTMSSILACAFGVDVDIESSAILEKLIKMDKYILCRNILYDINTFLYPGLLKALKNLLFFKVIFNFFLGMVKDITKARNGVPSNRKDFIDLILETKKYNKILESKFDSDLDNKTGCVKLTDEVIAANAFIFYIGGYDTNTIAISFMLYELAINTEIQDKLIAEVDEVVRHHDGNIEYEMICKLTYMEKVFNETLRKYPVLDLQRRAKVNYKIPGTEITIEKGTTIFVPTLGIHYDEKYYPNPTKFDPERFSSENESKRHSCAFLPFGAGPRYCIGMQFARILSRVFLVKLLSNFRVEVSQTTQTSIAYDPSRLFAAPKGGIHLSFIKRNQ